MKKMFLPLLLSALLLSGCAGPVSGTPGPSASPEHTDDVTCGPGVPYSMVCRIVDTMESGELLLAELETVGLIPSGTEGVFLLPTDDLDIWLDGEKADVSALEDGMPIHISYRQDFDGSFPAPLTEVLTVDAWSLGTEHNPGGGYYDLCGFYLKVLDDLWQEDAALNTDIPAVVLDLNEAPGGLTDTEMAALTWRFAQSHGVKAVENNKETLIEQGYLIARPGSKEGQTLYELTDACLFSITSHETEELEVYSLPVLRFDAHKYRGPLAAYWFSDCTAVWPEMGTWSEYQIGAHIIA